MKDLEKIQSPDLACQVQDANPGNFGIEQEVGAMVGATVPAPTEPSADDARELGAQLLVFLRRALMPIKSALRTALADIYAHLDSRCTDYTPAAYASYIPRPYDPMGLTPRTLPNLLTAITAFAPRKISNGSAPNDGIKDGESLVRLLCDTTTASQVTELIDDRSWGEYLRDAQSDITSKFPNLDKLTFGARVIRINSKYIVLFNKNLSYLYFPYLEQFYGVMTTTSFNGAITNSNAITKLDMPELRRIDVQYSELGPTSRQLTVQIANSCVALKEVIMPKCTYMPPGMASDYKNYYFTNCPNIERMVFGKLTAFNPWITQYAADTPMAKLIDIEFGEGVAINLNLAYWNPTNVLADADKTATFLQNFLEHICQRLANRTGQTKLTLTLSAAVYTAIMTDNDIKAELVARNWKVTDGTNNYNN